MESAPKPVFQCVADRNALFRKQEQSENRSSTSGNGDSTDVCEIFSYLGALTSEETRNIALVQGKGRLNAKCF